MKYLKKVFFTLSMVMTIFILVGCEKYQLDSQVENLCKKDGGIRIYETVTLPSEMFDRWGDPFPGWRGRKLEDRLGTDYRYFAETIYLKQGDPFQVFSEGVLSRSSERIIRLSDSKLMGESVVYGRTGGETILLGHPSGKICPVLQSADATLIRSVFLKKENK